MTREARKVAALDRGEIPIFEPALNALVDANTREPDRLRRNPSGIGEVEAVAAGTPSRRRDGHAGLSFVYEVVREIAPLLAGAAVVRHRRREPAHPARRSSMMMVRPYTTTPPIVAAIRAR